jgi:hypothetical protein
MGVITMFCNQCEETAKGTGCDGRQRSLEYYTEFTRSPPDEHGDPHGRLCKIPVQQP